MIRSPPLRFLAAVLGGWAALRTALVAPPWPAPAAGPTAVAGAQGGARPSPGPEAEVRPVDARRAVVGALRILAPAAGSPDRTARREPGSAITPPSPTPAATGSQRAVASAAPARPPLPQAPLAALPGAPSAGGKRWSLSAWSFVRRGGSAPLAAGGLLGGSQAGARLTYRLNGNNGRPLALSFRLSAALSRTPAAEAAVGVDWKPDRRLPVHVLAERREALSREGRSAFAVTVLGGLADAPIGPFRLDAYGQAGLVGARSRDPFVDGSVRLSIPVGKSGRLGAGAWTAAQPGASRLDLGPQAAIRLPVGGRALTVAADWRIRVAGDSGPGSGPTLTLGSDF